jgi:hypothetical protein
MQTKKLKPAASTGSAAGNTEHGTRNPALRQAQRPETQNPKPKTTNNKQQTTNNKQQTTNNKQQTTNY